MSVDTRRCDACGRVAPPSVWGDRLAQIPVGGSSVDICDECAYTVDLPRELADEVTQRVANAARAAFPRNPHRPRGTVR